MVKNDPIQNITNTWDIKCWLKPQLFMWGHFILWVRDYHADYYTLQWCKWNVHCNGIRCLPLGDLFLMFPDNTVVSSSRFKCPRTMGTNYPVMKHHISKEQTPTWLSYLQFSTHSHIHGQTKFHDSVYKYGLAHKPTAVSSCYNHHRLVKRKF